ncbi:thiol-disulfide isomerase/thioredoxin [Mariprofundus ferrooxydans PV-1]|jgi:small redox-active disulfide protein 2|uniref:Thiol-disulfide isomerase/thioredoxin n=2 Tax=Mariprofundus ferrooxydans TaxID=314344 RepID=Q0F3Q4_9PROT|nr:thiol-disulfide isomerase/thioredoxin [Mariprofundus ferrooxydans PV-1]
MVMKEIKVLGSGCNSCRKTMEMIAAAAEEKNVKIVLEKVEDMQAIISYGVMSTPGIVVDGEVVHAGGLPSRKEIDLWLSQ